MRAVHSGNDAHEDYYEYDASLSKVISHFYYYKQILILSIFKSQGHSALYIFAAQRFSHININHQARVRT